LRELRREGIVARSGRGYVLRIAAPDLEPRRRLAAAASTA
jgi:hypothetical protein